MPSLLQSTRRTILPFPGSLPKEPIISTPTYTSPEGATAKAAGLGTRSGPAKAVMVNSSGQLSPIAKESIKANDSLLSWGKQLSVSLLQLVIKAINKRRRNDLDLNILVYIKNA